MAIDFNFTTNGYTVTLLPNTDQAVEAYNLVCDTFEGGVIPVSAWASVRYQLRQAGYKVVKQRRRTMKTSDAELLADLLKSD